MTSTRRRHLPRALQRKEPPRLWGARRLRRADPAGRHGARARPGRPRGDEEGDAGRGGGIRAARDLILFSVYAEGRDPGRGAAPVVRFGRVLQPAPGEGLPGEGPRPGFQIVRLEVFDGAGTGPDQLLRQPAGGPHAAGAVHHPEPPGEPGLVDPEVHRGRALPGRDPAAFARRRVRLHDPHRPPAHRPLRGRGGELAGAPARGRPLRLAARERGPLAHHLRARPGRHLHRGRRGRFPAGEPALWGDYRLHDGRAPAHAPVGHRAPRRPGRRRRGDAPGAGPRDRGGVAGAQGAPQGRHHLLGGGRPSPSNQPYRGSPRA